MTVLSYITTKEMKLLAASLLVYLLFLVYMTVALNFNMFRSDVLGYWLQSYHLSAPFSTWWVPGYAFMIAGVRAITFDVLSPIAVMLVISGFAYVIAILTVYRLIRSLGVSFAFESALLFSVYPLVGLTYCVYPLADSIATALLLLCLFFYQKRNWMGLAFFLAVLLMTQKATWFFALPLVVIVFIDHKEARLVLPFAFIPLVVWIVAGAFHHNDLLWFMRWSTNNLLKSKSALPVFDGIIGSVLVGEANKMVKGVLALAIFVAAVFLAYDSYRHSSWLGVSISMGIILMGLFVNQYEIWAMVRFSKVLLIPYVSRLAIQMTPVQISRWVSPCRLGGIVLLAFLSNMAYGLYLAKFFFP